MLGEYSNEHFEKIKKTYFDARFRLVKIYSDTVPVIKVLRRKYIVGVMSNGNTYPEKIGLDGLFDFTLYADDIGISKPDKGIFLKLLKDLGLRPEELLHVGDSLENDIFPALELGINAVLITREDNKSASIPEHIVVIKSLLELNYILNTF